MLDWVSSRISVSSITHTYLHSTEHRECEGIREEKKAGRNRNSAVSISRTPIHHMPYSRGAGECEGIAGRKKASKESRRNGADNSAAIRGILRRYQRALHITSMHTHMHTHCESELNGKQAGASARECREILRRNSSGSTAGILS